MYMKFPNSQRFYLKSTRTEELSISFTFFACYTILILGCYIFLCETYGDTVKLK